MIAVFWLLWASLIRRRLVAWKREQYQDALAEERYWLMLEGEAVQGRLVDVYLRINDHILDARERKRLYSTTG